MKKQLLILVTTLLTTAVFAQVNVKFGINHLLNGEELTKTSIGYNNVENDFLVGRLQYYISEIKVIHDGGTITPVEDKYILVDALDPKMEDLGQLDLTTIEGITFSIGVNQPVNNEDPAQWPMDHALAPKFPSMHWGWAAGYRFIALEGKTGPMLNTTYEIHALGAKNYFSTTVSTEAKMIDGSLVIGLNADYANALVDIDLSSGVITHGDFGQAIDLLENFRDTVFSSADGVVGIKSMSTNLRFEVFPNPSTSGFFSIKTSSLISLERLEIIDLQGRKILETLAVGSETVQFKLPESGVFTIRVYDHKGQQGIQRLIVI